MALPATNCLKHRVGEGRADVLPGRILARETVVARGGNRVVAARKPEPHERLGIVDGDRLQKQRVDGAEQGCVGANAEGERKDDDGGPARGSEERAETVADVSQHDGIRRSTTAKRWVKCLVQLQLEITASVVTAHSDEGDGFVRSREFSRGCDAQESPDVRLHPAVD